MAFLDLLSKLYYCPVLCPELAVIDKYIHNHSFIHSDFGGNPCRDKRERPETKYYVGASLSQIRAAAAPPPTVYRRLVAAVPSPDKYLLDDRSA